MAILGEFSECCKEIEFLVFESPAHFFVFSWCCFLLFLSFFRSFFSISFLFHILSGLVNRQYKKL